MKKLKIGGAVAAVFLALGSWASSLEVTDVKIAQRYPWNGLVDITYTVQSDDPNKDVWVYPVGYDADTATSVALNPQYLSGEGANGGVKPGARRMTWDMASQMGKDYNRAAFSVSFIAYCDAKPYMVVDLSEGSSAKDYPISYLSSIPDGGWTEEYKTTKMLFRLIPPGLLDCGAVSSPVQITKPFYFAVWPLTTQQHALIMGGSGDGAIKSGLSYNDIRGNVLGASYPMHQQVDADSIVGRLRLRTGVTFDLGTQWQWLSAATAYTIYNTPTTFGIYQMGSNVEWCVNWYGGADTKIDPTGPQTNEHNARAVCGMRIVVRTGHLETGSYSSYTRTSAENCCAALDSYPVYQYYNQGYSMYTTYLYYTPGTRTHSYSAGHDPVCRLVALPNCK